MYKYCTSDPCLIAALPMVAVLLSLPSTLLFSLGSLLVLQAEIPALPYQVAVLKRSSKKRPAGSARKTSI
jgi:hypothetical protein